MSNDKSALTLILGLLIGVGLGFMGAMLTGSDDGNEVPPAVGPAIGVRDVSESVDRSPTPRLAVAEPTTATPMAASVSAEEIDRAVAVAEGAAEAAAQPGTGDGQIEGVVRSVDGQPLGRVLLVATQRSRTTKLYGSDPENVGRGTPSERSLRTSLSSSASSWAESQGRKYRMRADGEGQFALTGLPEGSYSVRGYAEGWVFESSPSGYVPANGSVVYLTGTRVRDVEIDVRLPDGAQPEIAAVVAKIGDNTSTFEWRPSQPTLRLREGSGTLQAQAEIVALGSGYKSPPALESNTQTFAADVASLTLHLQPNTGLWGEVRDTWSSGNNWFQVKIIAVNAGQSLQDSLFDSPDRSTNSQRGIYHFDDLKPGTYGLALTSQNRTVLHSEVATVGEELTRHDLEVGEPDPANHIRVTCIGPEGHVLSGVTFQHKYSSGDKSSSGRPSVKRSPEGIYWVDPRSMIQRGVEADFRALPAGTTVELTAKHGRYGSKTASLASAQRSVEIRFASPCTLEVQVIGYETSPMRAKLRLNVRQKTEDSSSSFSPMFFGGSRNSQPKLSSSGKAVYDTLSPGTWVVSLQAQHATQWGTSQSTIAEVEIELSSGTRRVDLQVPPLHDLEIHAPGLEPDTHLWLQRVEEGGNPAMAMNRSGQLGSNRRIRWTGLPAGTYRVQGGNVASPMEVRVPGPVAVFEGAAHDSLQVAISSEEGLLYKAGFRAGDLVVAVDGTELNSSNLYNGYQKPGKKKLTVLRGGERRELELDLSDMWQRASELGGTMMPAARPRR